MLPLGRRYVFLQSRTDKCDYRRDLVGGQLFGKRWHFFNLAVPDLGDIFRFGMSHGMAGNKRNSLFRSLARVAMTYRAICPVNVFTELGRIDSGLLQAV